MRRLTAVVVASLALAACGGGDGDEVVEDDAPASAIQDELGCDSFTEQDTGELFVRELYACDKGGETTNVYTFNTSEARDSWREVAEGFGAVVLAEGDIWLEVEPI